MPTVTHVETRQAQGQTATTASFTAPAGAVILVTAAALNVSADTPSLTISDSGIKTGSWTALGPQQNVESYGTAKGGSRAWWATANGAAGTITVATSTGGAHTIVAFSVDQATLTAGVDASSYTSTNAPTPIGSGLNATLWSPLATTDLISTVLIWETTDTAVTPGSGWTETFEGAHIASTAGSGHSGGAGACLKLHGQKATGVNADARTVTGTDYWSWRWTVGFLSNPGEVGDATASFTFTGLAEGDATPHHYGDAVAAFTFTTSSAGDTTPFDQESDATTAMTFVGWAYGTTDEPISFAQSQSGRGTCYIEIPVLGAVPGAANFPLADAWGNEFDDATELNVWLETNYPRLRWDPVRRLVAGCALGPLPNLALVESVRGAATGSFTFTSTSDGDETIPLEEGDGNATIGFSATAEGEATSGTSTGDGNATITFSAVAEGTNVIEVIGSATGAFTFTSSSTGTVTVGAVAVAATNTNQANSNTVVTAVTPASGELLVVVATVCSLSAVTPVLTISDSGVKSGSWTALTAQQNQTVFARYSGTRIWTASANGSSGNITVTNTASQSDPVLSVVVYRVVNAGAIENWTIQAGDLNFGSGFGTLNNTLPWTPAASTLLLSSLAIVESANCAFDPGSGWTEHFEPVHVTAAAGSGHSGGGTCLKVQGQSATNKTAVTRTNMSGDDWQTYHWVVGVLQG